MHCTVMTREGTRLCERGCAQITLEGPRVHMALVVHDHTCAFREDPATISEFADEVCCDLLIILLAWHFNFQVRALGHRLKTSVRLALLHIPSP